MAMPSFEWLLAPRRTLAAGPARGLRQCIDVRQRRRQRVELLLPVLAVAVEPHGRAVQCADREAAAADATAALLLHQPRPHQHLDVARYGLQRDVVSGRQFRYQQRMPVETLEDVAPYRVSEGEEHLVEAHLIGLRRRL